jgi:hypothetical protein
MFAKDLETTLTLLCEKSDMSIVRPDEIGERFEALRSYRKLPVGRERRDQPLTNGEIAAAILGLTSTNPKWAGHAAIVLCNLRPVGGADASFLGALTLQKSVELILADVAARKSVIRLTVSGAESSTNSHGIATLLHEAGNARRRAFFVPKEALSWRQPGAERDFDPDRLNSPVSKEISFHQGFFERIAREIERTKAYPVPPPGDGSEYDAKEALQERYRRLGIRSNSRFLNMGVETQVTWPREETIVKFDEYQLVRMPKTRDHVQSIHVDLTLNRLTDREAITVMNRYLSIMTWCDDQFAILQDGWLGNPVPVAVRRRDLAFVTTHHWIFDRRIPISAEAKRALALYREARNAQQNSVVSYAVLNYYKVVELRYHKSAAQNWFRDNSDAVSQTGDSADIVDRFSKLCGRERPHEYLWKACLIAVAHANTGSKSDPDDANELTRLHTAAEIPRVFARLFINREPGVFDTMYSGQ